MVKHIMLLSLIENEDAPDNIEKIKEQFLHIASESSGIVKAEIGENYSSSEYDLSICTVFKTPPTLKHFQTNPKYAELKKFIDSVTKNIAYVDYMVESENIIDKTEPVVVSPKPAGPKATAPKTSSKRSSTKAVALAKDSVPPVTVVEINDGTEQAAPVSAPKKTATRKSTKPAQKDDKVVTRRIEPKGKQIEEGEFAMEDAWKCPACGKINGAFVGICGCGADRPEFYTPLSNDEVLEARMMDEYVEETTEIPLLKGDFVAPSMDDYVNVIKPVISRTVSSIKRSTNDNYVEDDTSDTLASRAAANISEEDKVDLIRIEPKGKQLEEGQSAMEDAWKCPACGKINGAFVGICGCGADKPDEYIPVPAKELAALKKSTKTAATTSKTTSKTAPVVDNTPVETAYITSSSSVDGVISKRIDPRGKTIKEGEFAMEDAWKCPTCGKINGAFVGICGCGADKPAAYTPLSNDEVLEARMMDEYKEEVVEVPLSKNNILAPSMDDYVNAIKPVISRTMTSIMKATNENYVDPSEDTSDTLASRAAANLSEEDKVELIRIEPKGKQLEEGQSAMEDAWKCPACGKINGAFVGICGCGADKPDEYTPVPAKELAALKKSSTAATTKTTSKAAAKVTPVVDDTPVETAYITSSSSVDGVISKRIDPRGKRIREGEFAMEDAWKCPACGKINGNFVGICGCGADKPAIYTPLSNDEVLEARMMDEYKEEAAEIPLSKNNILAPSMDDYVNVIKPVISRTVTSIMRATNEDFVDPSYNEDTLASRAAANLDSEEKIEVVRIEPKGKQIKDGESAMVEAWKCPACGKINGGFVGICGCGSDKPDQYVPVSAYEIEEEKNRTKTAAQKKAAASTAKKKPAKPAPTGDDAYEQLIKSKKPVLPRGNSKKDAAYNDTHYPTSESNSVSSDGIIRIEPRGSAPRDGESAMNNGWTCPQCGKQNASYIGKCGCGRYKNGDESDDE